jgi:glycosyltransferase involved in cell wall biosynthesis
VTENLTTITKDWQISRLLEELPEYTTELGICLTRLTYFVYCGRQDLLDLMPISSLFYRTSFLVWLHEHSPVEYQFPQEWMPQIDLNLLDVLYKGELVECASAKLTKLDVIRWLLSPALNGSLDLSNESDCKLLSTFGAAFFRSHKHLTLSGDVQREASEVTDISLPDLAIPINKLAHWIWRSRKDLQNAFPLQTLYSQALYMHWLLSSGVEQLNLASYAVRQFDREHLNGPSPLFPAMSRIAHLMWQSNPDYPAEKDDKQAQANYADWFKNCVSAEFGVAKSVADVPTMNISNVEDRNHVECLKVTEHKLNGLNILGAMSGDFGLGEHARTTAMAALNADIPTSLISFANIQSEQNYNDNSLNSNISNTADHKATVFVGAPYSLIPQLSRTWDALHTDSYKIYFGAWELETLPPIDKEQIEFFFDEAWAQSRFQYACLAKQLRMPVTYMPLAIREAPAIKFQRFQFGLPERRFLFLYTFDGSSGLSRKNPFASIESFRAAFPNGSEPVGLVLKTKNISNEPAGALLREMASNDSRIFLIEANFSKEETYGLQSVCDAYISLHRAEGFGMTIAEAMLLEKPTIATNYSGNTDFCLPDTCCLVDYKLIPIEPGEYRFSEGQKWADADIDSAAAHMRNLVSDRQLAARIGMAGAQYVRDNHSLASVGARMKSRTAEIMTLLA